MLPRWPPFRLLQLGQPLLVLPGPRQPMELTQAAKLRPIRPDYPVAVLVAPRRYPARPQPAANRVPRHLQQPGQAAGPILVTTQPRVAAVAGPPLDPQTRRQPQHHLTAEAVGSLRRLEPLGVERRRDLRRVETLRAQRPQTLHQSRVVGPPVVAADPPGQHMSPPAAAGPAQL